MISEFTKEKVFWTRMMNLNLVNFIKSRPNLWNPKHPKYKSVNYRDKAYAEFAANYGNQFTGQAVKDHWTNIRTTYYNYLRKVMASCAGDGVVYKVPWHLWDACSFLSKVTILNKTNADSSKDDVKVSNTPGPKPTSCAAATENDIPIVITSSKRGYITRKAVDLIQEGLNAKLDSLASGDLIVPGPAFLGRPKFVEGSLRLLCADQATVEWTRASVSELNIPDVDNLVVLHPWDIPKRIRCRILIPQMCSDGKLIGRHLLMSNPWAKVEKWLVHSIQPQETTGSTFVVVSIPEEIVPDILRRQRRLSFRLGAVYIKFRGVNGRFTDTPPGDNKSNDYSAMEESTSRISEDQRTAEERTCAKQGPSQETPPMSEEEVLDVGSLGLDKEDSTDGVPLF